MSSASVLEYFLSLKRCELSEVNNDLDRRFLSQVQISEFKKDGVIVIDDVFSPLEIYNAVLAFRSIESLMKNETMSHADINLEAPGGGWKGQKESITSHPGHNESPTARQALIFRYEKIGSYERSEISSSGNSIASVTTSPQREPGDQLVLSNTHNGREEVGLKSYSNAGKGPQIISQRAQTEASPLRIFPVSDMLARGEKESIIEKTHLISARVFRQEASKKGINFLDMGTDYHYPFYDAYPLTQAALLALKKNNITVLHYPSSFGLQSLRQAFQVFMYSRFSVTLDCMDEIMINTGASQAFDALSRAFKGRYVILPQLALPTVGVIACGNGAELLRIEPDTNGGIMDLSVAQKMVDEMLPGGIRFLYLNSPVNPTGSIATRDQLCRLVDFAKKNNIIVVHDMDSWYTQHQGSNRLYNILEIPGAMDCCVTVLSISKEFGLPGLRVGFIAGNSRVINTVRAHNSTFAVMIPEVCQLAAQAALENFCKGGKERNEIDNHIAQVLQATIKGWTSLGWPESKIYPPSAGFKYLVSVPPNIKGHGAFSSIELFDFFVTSRASVKLSTSRSFDPGNSGFVRIVLMQNPKEVFEVFRRLASIGVSYTMVLPDGLENEYESFLKENMKYDF
ncbi:hypothetical protein BFJ66_g49 [Fusarium oxysporum f. sp. cepae]|uniref:Aminotransferase class I/classII large domain-containing protein n=1 Tax=Fusarium oxysporum f. sp. cepae TaxID=396571 RepID=A0A3L6NZR7_FUSOX|nr:hypothetical protein BFJ65_g3284 [Fusarium oxysporum f. sp. cepae]RKK59239.1 hypothetical protein BFJ67_g2768 [Fusarium oxysporum f. sp. cepae]RKK64155.1 hypothetical protein BFJ66_g49 [Fusarium oxysporum f. sp. cepae]